MATMPMDFSAFLNSPAIGKKLKMKLLSGKGLKPKDILKLQMAGVALPSSSFEFEKTKELYGITKEQLQKILAEGGFSPEALAAMRSEAIEGTATQFSGAREAIATELARRGLRTGMAPISGEALRRTAELGGAQAIATSSALRDIAVQNERQRLQNVFNALNIASGFPANPNAPIGAASGAANSIAALEMAQGQGFWGSLGSSLAGTLAGTAGGALGKVLKRIPGLG